MNNIKEKHLSVSEGHALDVKKVMDDIDYLNSMVKRCDENSVLEMYKTQNSLNWISDRELIRLSEFRKASKRLEDIGKIFKEKCYCVRTIKSD